jgi:hypothetical protein
MYGTRLPSASGPGRVVYLTLADGQRFEMSTNYLNDTPPLVETGTWEYRPDESVRVSILVRSDRVYEKPQLMTFVREGNGLIAVDYDRSAWGPAGLRLERQPDILGRVWRLVAILDGTAKPLRPDDPSRFTLEMSVDGKVTTQADCNRGAGMHVLAGRSLTFRNMVYTTALCPRGSLFDQYARFLSAATSCMVRDGFLYVAAPQGTVMLQFEASPN